MQDRASSYQFAAIQQSRSKIGWQAGCEQSRDGSLFQLSPSTACIRDEVVTGTIGLECWLGAMTG